MSDTVDRTTERLITEAKSAINQASDNVSNRIVTSLNPSPDGTWDSIIREAKKHPVGLSAQMTSLLRANSPQDVVCALVTTASLLGLEQLAFKAMLDKLSTTVSQPTAQAFDFGSIKGAFESMTGGSSDKKRLLGLIGVMTSLAGVSVGETDVLKPIRTAVSSQQSLEKLWDSIEEYLNKMGFISTGKHAYLDELGKKFEDLREEMEYHAHNLAVKPSLYCRSHEYTRFCDFKNAAEALNSLMLRNTTADFRNSTVYTNLSSLLLRIQGWTDIVANTRSMSGFRPYPVGVAFQGGSQFGKTEIISELQLRVTRRLKQLYDADPENEELQAFAHANQWTRWSVQQRDDYDEGYSGQEITYVDDAFSDSEQKDHPMYLTFMSTECVGTVQARLTNKGLPFTSRAFFVTLNEPPQKSVTIKNLYALWERFPHFISVRLKNQEDKYTEGMAYDPEFSKLEFHKSTMVNSCLLPRNNATCTWHSGGEISCGARAVTLAEIVDDVVESILLRERQFLSKLTYCAESEGEDVFGGNAEYDESKSEVSQKYVVEEVDDYPYTYTNFEPSTSGIQDDDSDSSVDSTPDPAYPVFQNTKLDSVVKEEKWAEVDKLNNPVVRHLLNSFANPPVLDINDKQIVSWASYLYHEKNGVSYPVLDWLREHEVTEAWQLFSNLHRFEVKENQRKPFLAAWEQATRNGLRFNSPRHGRSYFCSWALDAGTTFVEVPYEEGVIPIIGEKPEHKPLLLIACQFSGRMLDRVTNTPFEIYRLRRPEFETETSLLCASRGESRKEVMHVLRTKQFMQSLLCGWAGSMILFTNFIASAANMVGKQGSPSHVSLKLTCALKLAVQDTHLPQFLANQTKLVYVWSKLKGASVKSLNFVADQIERYDYAIDWCFGKFGTCLRYVQCTFEYMKHLVSYMLLKLAEVFNIPVNATMEYIFDCFSSGVVATMAATVISLFCALLYGIYRLVRNKWRSPTTRRIIAQSVTSNKAKKVRTNMRTRRLKTQSVTSKGKQVKTKIARKTRQKLRTQATFDSCLESCENSSTYQEDTRKEYCNTCDLITGTVDIIGQYIAIPLGDPKEGKFSMFVEEHTGDLDLVSWTNAALTLVEDNEFENACLNISYGRGSGSSGYHTKGVVCRVDDELIQITEFGILEIRFVRYLSFYQLEIEFAFTRENLEETLSDIEQRLSKLGNYAYSFMAVLSGDTGLGYISCPHTFTEGKICNFDRTRARQFAPIISSLTTESKVLWIKVDEELNLVPDEEELPIAQGIDDASVTLCLSLTSKYSCTVVNPFRSSILARTDNETLKIFDKAGGSATAGILFKNFILIPFHLAKIGAYLKVFKQKGNKDVCNSIYGVYQCLYRDAASHIGIARHVPGKEFVKVLCEKGFNVSRMDFPKLDFSFPADAGTWIYDHCMTDDQLSKIRGSIPIVQYLPTRDILTTGEASLAGLKRMRWYDPIEGNCSDTISLLQVECFRSSASLTQAGDCGGMLLALNSQMPKKLLGFHVFGSDIQTWAAILTTDLVDSLVEESVLFDLKLPYSQSSEIKIIGDQTSLDDLEYTPGGIASLGHKQITVWPAIKWASEDPFRHFIGSGPCPDVPVGPCARKVGRYLRENRAIGATKSKWQRSPFWGAFPVELEPCILSIKDNRRLKALPRNQIGEESLLWPNYAAAEGSKDLDISVLSSCVEQMLSYFTLTLTGKPIGIHCVDVNRVLDYGLNGVPFGLHVKGIVLDSSPGLPWSDTGLMLKGKFVDILPNNGRKFACHEEGGRLKKVCANKLSQARFGKRVSSFCASKLKDCLVKRKHVENGKTRVFNASSFESVICGNALFACFKELYIQNADKFFHFLGKDVNSNDWHFMWQEMRKHPYVFDVDYEQYDKRIKSLLMRCAYLIIIETIQAVDPDPWRTARYVLAEDDINSLMVDNVSVWFSEHSNPSGSHFTTIINNVVNDLIIFYCYSQWKGIVDISHYMEHVERRFLGDDVLISVSDVAQGFNRAVLIPLLAEVGMKATSADKIEGAVQPFSTWDTAQFLKGTTVNIEGFYVYALEKSSIESCFSWTQVDSYEDDIWHQLVKTHLEFAVPHGVCYYEYVRTALAKAAASRTCPSSLRQRIAPVLSLDHATQTKKLVDRLGGFVEVHARNAPGDNFRQFVERHGGDLYGALMVSDIPRLKDMEDQLHQLAIKLQKFSQIAETAYIETGALRTDMDRLTSTVNQLSILIPDLSQKVDFVSDQLDLISDKVEEVVELAPTMKEFIKEFPTVKGIAEMAEQSVVLLSNQLDSIHRDISALTIRSLNIEDEISKLYTRTDKLEARPIPAHQGRRESILQASITSGGEWSGTAEYLPVPGREGPRSLGKFNFANRDAIPGQTFVLGSGAGWPKYLFVTSGSWVISDFDQSCTAYACEYDSDFDWCSILSGSPVPCSIRIREQKQLKYDG